MQQPYLFGGSVRSNIALGNPSMTMEAVIDAATLAHIHDDIVRMPLGYDTMLASGGACLSGGQRQRLALARVLARRPSILVLDEATNALDAVTETEVLHELRDLRCTTIVVAHRLSTVAAADLILVLDNGDLVEQGTHRELLARDGVYANLVHTQVEGADVRTGRRLRRQRCLLMAPSYGARSDARAAYVANKLAIDTNRTSQSDPATYAGSARASLKGAEIPILVDLPRAD